jgi:soluble lytic murein transglycosylase
MQSYRFFSLAVLCLLLLLALPLCVSAASGALSDKDQQIYRHAFAALRQNRYAEAEKIADRASDPILAKAVHWHRLRYQADFDDFGALARFVAANPDWPQMQMLRHRAELAMTDAVPDAVLNAWFEKYPPEILPGRIARARLLAREGNRAELAALVRETWVSMDFSPQVERGFLKDYGEFISEKDHISRLDRLLWEKEYSQAYRMMSRVPTGYRLVAEARRALQRSEPGVEGAVARVPAALRTDPGLVYERARFRRLKLNDEAAQDLLLSYRGAMPYGALWATELGYQSRKLLRLGQKDKAYQIASNNRITDAEPLSDVEFLAGWIALRHLKQPEEAYRHFTRLHEAVSFPISVARGAYWRGRAVTAMGKTDQAQDFYRQAAKHYVTFYGQLAAQELGLNPVAHAALRPAVAAAASPYALYHSDLAQAIVQMAAVGEHKRIVPFAQALYQQSRSPEGLYALASLLHSVKRPDLAVTLAKQAKNDGISAPEAEFPLLRFATMMPDADPALALALMRQESLFRPDAVSYVGARGLMQLMPATAQMEARAVGVPYSLQRLTTDPGYNVRLGTNHMVRLVNRYQGSYPLVLAAYNAGSGNVDKWLRDYGDPRRGDITMLDWIEFIPFRETRSYVQRVLEGLEMYRVRIATEQPGQPLKVKAFTDGWCSFSCSLAGISQRTGLEGTVIEGTDGVQTAAAVAGIE